MKSSLSFATRLAALLGLLLVLPPAQAQLAVDVTDDSGANALKIAVPPLPTSQSVATPAGTTQELGQKIAQVIADDLAVEERHRPGGAAVRHGHLDPAGVRRGSPAGRRAPWVRPLRLKPRPP